MQKIKRFSFSSAQKSLTTYGFIGCTQYQLCEYQAKNISPNALPLGRDACELDIIAAPGAGLSRSA